VYVTDRADGESGCVFEIDLPGRVDPPGDVERNRASIAADLPVST
jgi:hypothetical protein